MTPTPRKRATTRAARARASTKQAPKAAPNVSPKHTAQSTHVVSKTGTPLKGSVTSEFEPSHGPNMDDRMDVLDTGVKEPAAARGGNTVTRAARVIPQSRRVDPGQDSGGAE